jgi:hypothetical protein
MNKTMRKFHLEAMKVTTSHKLVKGIMFKRLFHQSKMMIEIWRTKK